MQIESPDYSDDNQEVTKYSHEGDKTVEQEKCYLNFSDEDKFLVYVARSKTAIPSYVLHLYVTLCQHNHFLIHITFQTQNQGQSD